MQGAALATVIGQVVSFIVSLIGLFKTKSFRLTFKSLIPKLNYFKVALKLGLSSFITQITIVIISLVCNIILAKYGSQSKFGIDIPIAIIGIESKVFTVIINLVVGIVLGCQPIISYNMGAKKYKRVKHLYRNILICTFIIGLLSTFLFECAPEFIVGLFGKPTNIPNPEDYWEFGKMTFRIFLMLIIFTCIIKMTSIFFQAVEKPGKAILASMIRDIVCFIPLIIIMPLFFGIKGVLWSAPISDFLALIVAIVITIPFFKNLIEIKENDNSDVVLKKSIPGYIITIAREHGSSGKEIGKLIANKLNIPFYFKEITALAAKESGLDQEFISEVSNDIPNMVNKLYLSTNVVENAIIAQEKIIRKITENGSCVIVGRAADYVLRENNKIIKIFIYTNMNIRIERVMKNYNDDYTNAIKHISKSDIARSTYYKNITGNEWKNLNNYDISINSSNGVEETADILIDYIRNIQKQN